MKQTDLSYIRLAVCLCYKRMTLRRRNDLRCERQYHSTSDSCGAWGSNSPSHCGPVPRCQSSHFQLRSVEAGLPASFESSSCLGKGHWEPAPELCWLFLKRSLQVTANIGVSDGETSQADIHQKQG